MIDEKKLIECLRYDISCFEGCKNKKDTEIYVSVYDVIRMIEGQPKVNKWIPCSKRLPKEKTNPITNDFCEYQVTFKSGEVTDIRHYKFGRGHWWNGPGIMDKYVVAWREPLEPYHEDGGGK